MHHDHVLKKLNFDLMTPPPGLGGGRGSGSSVGNIFASMLLHSLIPFNLICNLTMFGKIRILIY